MMAGHRIHIALSTLMALFPFIILVTALAASFLAPRTRRRVAKALLETWPREVATPDRIRDPQRADDDARRYPDHRRRAAVYSPPAALKPAHRAQPRPTAPRDTQLGLLRIESIVYVVFGAVALLALAF